MVKSKKKNNKSKSESVYVKKSFTKSKSTNPFEVQVNREKFQVLGRISRDGKGRPGVSRSKAVQKRKDTLGKEYQNKHKSNEFRDKRIGGRDFNENVQTARFTAEKLSQYQSKKKSLFNLNDDEVLTHKGQTLEEIEKYDFVESDVDSEEEGKLDANFTELANFGGEDENGENLVNRKSAIEEMILESKKRKIEKIKEKEEVEEMTNALDEKWKLLIPVVGKLTNRNNEKPKPDAYDKAMREMIFEPRGEPTDRLISIEDLAKKEKERLEKLEQERLARMNCAETKPKSSHRSIEELDDGYFLNPVTTDRGEKEILAYNVNEPIQEKMEEVEEENQLQDNQVESEGESDEDEESTDETDSLKDLKLSVSDSSEEEEVDDGKDKSIKLTNISNVEIINGDRQIPYTFEVPKKYSEFTNLLESHATNEIVVIERMIKCNHPKTTQQGNEKIATVLTYILQYINDLFSNLTVTTVNEHFKLFGKLAPQIFEIGQLNPENVTKLLKAIIKEKHEEYRKKKNKCPTVETLVYLKLVSLLFPTSDYRHEVVTPCIIFISQILSKMQVKTRTDIARGLFLVTLCLEYTRMSKRIIPSAMNFLQGVVYLASPKRQVEVVKIIPPFKSKGQYNSLLIIRDNESAIKLNSNDLMSSLDLVMTNIDQDFKLRALNMSFNLIHDLCDNLSSNVGSTYYALDYIDRLEKIPIELYPQNIKQNFERTIKLLKRLIQKPFTHLMAEKRNPKPLRLIEPKFEKIYDGMKKFNQPTTKELDEKQKLIHKIKRETKGAIREIRRDNEFIAKIQIKQQIHSDAERRQKVKRIYSEASVQQGELNAMDRSKKKKK